MKKDGTAAIKFDWLESVLFWYVVLLFSLGVSSFRRWRDQAALQSSFHLLNSTTIYYSRSEVSLPQATSQTTHSYYSTQNSPYSVSSTHWHTDTHYTNDVGASDICWTLQGDFPLIEEKN